MRVGWCSEGNHILQKPTLSFLTPCSALAQALVSSIKLYSNSNPNILQKALQQPAGKHSLLIKTQIQHENVITQRDQKISDKEKLIPAVEIIGNILYVCLLGCVWQCKESG